MEEKIVIFGGRNVGRMVLNNYREKMIYYFCSNEGIHVKNILEG